MKLILLLFYFFNLNCSSDSWLVSLSPVHKLFKLIWMNYWHFIHQSALSTTKPYKEVHWLHSIHRLYQIIYLSFETVEPIAQSSWPVKNQFTIPLHSAFCTHNHHTLYTLPHYDISLWFSSVRSFLVPMWSLKSTTDLSRLLRRRRLNYFRHPIKQGIHLIWKFTLCAISLPPNNHGCPILQGPDLSVLRKHMKTIKYHPTKCYPKSFNSWKTLREKPYLWMWQKTDTSCEH